MNAPGDAEQTDEPRPSLSVVVVTYNEADRVRTCLESVFDACEAVPDVEVVLVDSNSTDGTVERALEYPVTVLRIPDDELTTPAAGRHVGTRHASGDRILFVDGDMELADGWLPRALERLEEPGVAAVDGHLDEPAEDDEVRTVDSVRGVALYEADALEAVGGFDPFMQSVEDVNLGYRLTADGYRLERLPEVAAHHPPGDVLTEPLRRLRLGYMRGSGQALRRSMRSRSPRVFAMHLYRVRHRLVMTGWLLLGFLALVATPALLAWTLGTLVGVGVLVRRFGFLGAVSFLYYKGLSTVGLVLGFLERPEPPGSFPLEAVETVAEAPVVQNQPPQTDS